MRRFVTEFSSIGNVCSTSDQNMNCNNKASIDNESKFIQSKTIRSHSQIYKNINKLETEKCFHVELEAGTKFSADDEKKVKWILRNPQEADNLYTAASLVASKPTQTLIEVGPRFNFSTADSTNSVSICHSAQLTYVKRIEVSIRYLLSFDVNTTAITAQDEVSLSTGINSATNK